MDVHVRHLDCTWIFNEGVFISCFLCQKQCFSAAIISGRGKKIFTLMAEGDAHARNMLIEHNLRLVAHIVKKFENTGEDSRI